MLKRKMHINVYNLNNKMEIQRNLNLNFLYIINRFKIVRNATALQYSSEIYHTYVEKKV